MTMEPDGLELVGQPLAVQPNVLPGELKVALKRANDFAKAEKALNTVVACHQGVEHRARLSRG